MGASYQRAYTMRDFATKTYGRNEDVQAIYAMFDIDHDVSMPGPRRLGKTFVLDRLVDAAADHGWIAIKVEVAGCSDTRSFFREMCNTIESRLSGGRKAIDRLRQRLGQVVDPRAESPGPWYGPLVSLDHETYFERLIKTMNDDTERSWVLLIDELPIFLKALHDKGPQGVEAARNFMTLTSRLRDKHRRVRWMITGSIGLAPLAQSGNYMGVLAKFHNYELLPLSQAQAVDFVKDLATTGRLMHRRTITDVEARAMVNAVGWRAAYYLEALAQKLSGDPCEDAALAERLVEAAMTQLLQPTESPTFGVWEEHLRKHYRGSDRTIAFAVLAALAPYPQGRGVDALLAAVGQPDLTKTALRALLMRLHAEGFITVADWDSDDPTVAFLNPLLRRWWQRYQPQAAA